MRRILVALVLIGSICLQGSVFAARILGTDRSGDMAHAVLHADGIAHHHDGHGIVKDASERSKQHVQHDGCMHLAAALPAASVQAAGLFAASAPRHAADERHDAPFLEGLKRPPR